MSTHKKTATPENGPEVRAELQNALNACNQTIANLQKLKREILGEIPPENIPQKWTK